ncbi:MAG: DUF5711 family protein [Clostridiaceae bacterium]|nr:DUF5711 family protein [Clostridiaceae bacterium]
MKFSVRKNFIEGTHEDRRLYITRAAQRIVILLAVVAAVLGIYYFRNDISAWFREIQARQQADEKPSSSTYSRIAFEPDSENVYALFGESLAVINKGNFKLYGTDGTEQLALQLSYSRPALCVSDEQIIAYDRGGTNLTVAGQTALIGSLEIPGKIISVEANSSGYFTVTHEDARYRAVVSVYDNRQNLVYQWQTSEYYVMRASLAPDGKTMTATAYTQDDGNFISRMFYFDLNRSDSYRASADITGTIVTNTYYIANDTLCLVGDDRAVVTDIDGNVLYEYAYGNDMIKTGAAAESYVVLTMLDRTSGLGAKVVLFAPDAEGALVANTNDDIRKMSACGDYAAVLYTQGVQLFSGSLEPLSAEVDVSQVRDILVSEEGRVLLIYASDAGYVDLLSAFANKPVSGADGGETEGK